MNVSPARFLLNAAALTTLGVLLALPSLPARAECPADPSCEQLGQCKPFETFRIPFERIQACIREGIDPPLSWKRQGGRGAVNTGGMGDIQIGSLNNPYAQPGARGSGTDPGDGDGDDTPDGPLDCSTYISPRLIGPCDLRGKEVKLASGPDTSCGLSIQLDHEWAVFTRGATHAAIARYGDHTLRVYKRNGASLSMFESSPIPKFYCELRQRTDPATGQPEAYAHEIPVIPRNHYAQIAQDTNTVAIDMAHPEGAEKGLLDHGFMIMTRQVHHEPNKPPTFKFIPPKPNPEYFTSRGAKAENVNPQCRSLDRLLEPEPEGRFGDMQFGERHTENCQAETFSLHNFLPDPSDCMHTLQYMNGGRAQFIVPPDTSLSSGSISGGNPYSRKTIRGSDGSMTTTRAGTPFYTGPQLYVPGMRMYLGLRSGGVNEQSFLSGARFTLTDSSSLRIPPPGRIKLFADRRMQLLDGGIIEDTFGNIIRQVSPNAFVQFDKDADAIQGTIFGNLKADSQTIVPTNANESVIMPYDTRLDYRCEPRE